MQLQRIASSDAPKALLGPIQPDLSGLKPEGKRLYTDNPNNKSANHIKHAMPAFQANGSPMPNEEHYFRKALDNFTHDGETDKVTDPQLMRLKILMEGSKQAPEVETKNKVSTTYMLELMNSKKIPEKRQRLLFNLMEQKVDYRTLLKMKNHIFDRYPAELEISHDQWKKESARFMHIHDPKVEEELLEDICVDGKIDRHRVIELLDIYQFCPVHVKKDKNKSEDVYFVLNSNKRGAAQNKEEILA